MIRRLLNRRSTAFPETWQLGEENWPITLRRRPGTKRITMRVCGLTDTLRVSAPPSCSAKALREILDTYTETLTARVRELPPRQPFTDGAELPFLDGRLQIQHREGGRTHWQNAGDLTILTVGGQPEHFQRRVRDAVRKRAREELSDVCDTAIAKAAAAYTLRPLRRITLTDTRGRWGSCAADGTLRFSWRLIFAPRWVFAYVAAHEVAHLAEMSHSPRFWSVVDCITPDAQAARTWLQRYGSQIHRIGPAI